MFQNAPNKSLIKCDNLVYCLMQYLKAYRNLKGCKKKKKVKKKRQNFENANQQFSNLPWHLH